MRVCARNGGNRDSRVSLYSQEEMTMTHHTYHSPNVGMYTMAPADRHGGGGTPDMPGNFANDPKQASGAGHKGGRHSPGHLASAPRRAAEAGHKGGQQSSGNFANDPQRAADAGRKGGLHSHDKT